jgi:hypothetical protein
MTTATWDDVYMGVQAKCFVAEKYFEMRLHVEDTLNYAALVVWPNTVPHLPCGTWEIRQVVAGVPVLLASGNLDQFDLEVYYMWRFLHTYEGSDVVYHAYQDENLLGVVTTPNVWAQTHGSIALLIENSGLVHINKVKVSDFPIPSDFIGPA